jgi:hypothetical protein
MGMQQQQAYVQEAGKHRVTGSSMEAPECPPPGFYTLRLVKVGPLTFGKPYGDNPPQLQFTLEFKIVDPAGGDDGWHDFDLKGWYTPKMHYAPDYDPDAKPYTQPKLYKLCKALNGGKPLDLPTDEDGMPDYYPEDELPKLVGRTFVTMIEPSSTGWARIVGEPAPDVQPEQRRRRRTVEVVSVTPIEDDAVEDIA